MGHGPGVARGPPAARLGSRRPSLGHHSAHPGLSSTLFCRLLRLSSNTSMRTNVFFCLWDSLISQEFLLYSLPVSKGYLDPLGCVRSSDTPVPSQHTGSGSLHMRVRMARQSPGDTGRAGLAAMATRGPPVRVPVVPACSPLPCCVPSRCSCRSRVLLYSLQPKTEKLYQGEISRSVVSNSLRPHESQHTRPPCPSPTPGVHSDSRPSSQ